MTQLHFTLNIEDIQNLINTEVKNDMAKMPGSFLKKYPIKNTKENTEESRTDIKARLKSKISMRTS